MSFHNYYLRNTIRKNDELVSPISQFNESIFPEAARTNPSIDYEGSIEPHEDVADYIPHGFSGYVRGTVIA